MGLVWDFVAERYRVVTRLANERRRLKENANSGWKDKGKGGQGQGQSGDAKRSCCFGWTSMLPRLRISRLPSLPTPMCAMCQAAPIR